VPIEEVEDFFYLGSVMSSNNMNRRAPNKGRKRGRGRPRKNWPETIRGDLRILELMWEDALDAAEDRDGWRKRIASTGQTKDSFSVLNLRSTIYSKKLIAALVLQTCSTFFSCK